MAYSGKRLGMDRAISRRDFVNGIALTTGALALPALARPGAPPVHTGTVAAADPYPPARMGMRGAHPGSFEIAHVAVQGRRWEAQDPTEDYDLVVVGAGLSGLAAAYIYRRDVDRDARILLLDNHDDFGGHAKRNEFTLEGRSYIGYGGTMLMEATDGYPPAARQLIRELGIEPERHSDFYHGELFSGAGSGRATFFDRKTFGTDFLATGSDGFGNSIADLPLSESARTQLQRLYRDEDDYLAGMTPAERRAVLESHSWRAYLQQYAGMGEEVLTFVQKLSHGVWAIGADALPAWMAWLDGYPGFAGMDTGIDLGDGEDEGGHFYFPDGNASIARLLVRKLVPAAASGHSMEDLVDQRVDYAALDGSGNKVRVRLSSTVVELHHLDAKLSGDVAVTYVREGRTQTVRAAKVIWAGYHAMLPYLCPDLPTAQAEAMRQSVRAPLSYTNVLIRNWESLADAGVRRAYCPGSFFQTVMLTHPVSMGSYRFSVSPEDPVILHLQHIPLAPGLPAAEQFRAGRRQLLQTPFATFERSAREQLGRMFGPTGFDPAEDIAGITVNRWPHGYAYSVDSASGDVAWWPELWAHERRPWVEARQRIGNIAIAGTDAASNAMTESAIEEAYRAVQDLV